MFPILLQILLNVFSASYTVPQPYSLIVAILIIIFALWIGFVFIKDIIKVIFVFIILYILASIGYSFFTTGQLSLSGLASFTSSILDFFKYIIGAGHAVSSVAHKITNVANSINSTITTNNSINTTNTTR